VAPTRGGRLWWGVEWGMKEELCGVGKGRLHRLGNDDIMMLRVVLFYPSHARPLASLIYSMNFHQKMKFTSMH